MYPDTRVIELYPIDADAIDWPRIAREAEAEADLYQERLLNMIELCNDIALGVKVIRWGIVAAIFCAAFALGFLAKGWLLP